MEVIDRFDGEYGFLSNFYPSPVDLDGQTYSTVEHAFQAAKTTEPNEREMIRLASDPAKAKRLGRRVALRPDWETYRLAVMEELVRQKFSRYRDLRDKLLATGSAELVEGNTWHDTFWGVCNGKGRNYLGCILMRVRAELAGE